MTNKLEDPGKTPEVSREALEGIKSQALSGSLESHEFTIENINYVLTPCPSKNGQGEVNGQPAEYHQHPDANTWEIYIWEDLPEKIQRVLLFHEIIEIYFREKYGTETTPAHNAVSPYEKEFVRGYISEDEERTTQELRSKYGI